MIKLFYHIFVLVSMNFHFNDLRRLTFFAARFIIKTAHLHGFGRAMRKKRRA